MPSSKQGRTTAAVLTETTVRSLRLRAQWHSKGIPGHSVKEMAREYGVGVETIRRILRWDTWRWVSEEGPGAEVEEWAHPPLSPGEVAASLERLQALQAGEGSGMERLQKEAGRPQVLLDELTSGEEKP